MKAYEATEQAYKNGYKKGYQDGKRDAVKHGRLIEPIWCEEYTNYGYCSICGADNRMSNNYCGRCGADMRGTEDGK